MGSVIAAVASPFVPAACSSSVPALPDVWSPRHPMVTNRHAHPSHPRIEFIAQPPRIGHRHHLRPVDPEKGHLFPRSRQHQSVELVEFSQIDVWTVLSAEDVNACRNASAATATATAISTFAAISAPSPGSAQLSRPICWPMVSVPFFAQAPTATFAAFTAVAARSPETTFDSVVSNVGISKPVGGIV